MTEKKTRDFLDEEGKDILQEIMNIAFGNATADLAEVIDIYVHLSVPDIHVLNIRELPDYIRRSITLFKDTSIIEQSFWGDFSGAGLLVFPDRTGRDLIEILENNQLQTYESKPIAALEKEILLEIGNILIGACIGKVAELLETIVTYSPPILYGGTETEYTAFIDSFDPDQKAVAMKTVFEFNHKNIAGSLLLLANQETTNWLQKALRNFMEAYE